MSARCLNWTPDRHGPCGICEVCLAEWGRRDTPPPADREALLQAFRAGFDWCSKGTDKHGEYNGGSIEDGFAVFLAALRPTPDRTGA